MKCWPHDLKYVLISWNLPCAITHALIIYGIIQNHCYSHSHYYRMDSSIHILLKNIQTVHFRCFSIGYLSMKIEHILVILVTQIQCVKILKQMRGSVYTKNPDDMSSADN